MDRESLLKEMKESIGTKDPIVFFSKMVEVFDSLFNQIEKLQKEVKRGNLQSALSIKWEPRIAQDMILSMINVLRKDKDTYQVQLAELKLASMTGDKTQDYETFCQFWEDTLGWHPFFNYDK